MTKKHQELHGLSESTKSIFRLLSSDKGLDEMRVALEEVSHAAIAEAAAEALYLDDIRGYVAQWRDTKERSPRTMTRWSADDDAELVALFTGGIRVPRIAELLGRPESAIHRRLLMLNLGAESILAYESPQLIATKPQIGRQEGPDVIAEGNA